MCNTSIYLYNMRMALTWGNFCCNQTPASERLIFLEAILDFLKASGMSCLLYGGKTSSA